VGKTKKEEGQAEEETLSARSMSAPAMFRQASVIVLKLAFVCSVSYNSDQTPAVRVSPRSCGADDAPIALRRHNMCKSCSSSNQSIFSTEVAIHFPGLKGLEMPIVWVFPKLKVCLKCGRAEFAIPDGELRELKQGAIKVNYLAPPSFPLGMN
jgi:hypothetical protein